MKLSIKVNGREYKTEVNPERRLLDFLRDDLGLKGTKYGCDQGECGACSVILNDQVVTSCIVLMAQLPENSEVLTVESTDSLIKLVQESFGKTGAAQCGACTPGMVMAAAALLKTNPTPSQSEIEDGLSGVLCRCTGYIKIYDAIRLTQDELG
ncbi:MAG: (2Fe-2S)-binding protein [Candidatus Hodarchaeales archaeon]|jgi:carbon-monoxide dehydrogenase small subunit